MDLLREAWKPGASTLRDLLLTLRELLAAPNPADSVNPEAAREMLEDRAAVDAHAEAEVKKVRGRRQRRAGYLLCCARRQIELEPPPSARRPPPQYACD